MSIGILGKKIGMTRLYKEGVAIPVTVIQAEPNIVTQVKTSEKDGYSAVQLAVGKKKASQTTKPLLGHYKKSGTEPKANIREFQLDNGEQITLGQEIKVTNFTEGQLVDIIGLSKGRGFQGVMKRHNYEGQPDSHGSKMHRRTGAIGMRSTPGRIHKNRGMPGHMGNKKVTVQNLRVVQVREQDNVLLIKGAVPGNKGNLVIVRNAIKSGKANGKVAQ